MYYRGLKKGLNAVAVEHIIALAEGERRVMHQQSIDVIITCNHVVQAWLHWQTPDTR